MATALAVSAALFGLLVVLLAVPLDITFRFEGIEGFNGLVAIRWLFGLVRFRVRIPGAGKLSEPQAAPRVTKVRSKRDRRATRSDSLAVLSQPAFRRRVYRLAKDLAGALHLRQLRLRVRLGLGDPADTGCLWAFVGPVNAAAQHLRGAEVQIEPDFMDPVLEFDAQGRLLLVPLQFLALAIGFALSPASFHAWRTLHGRHA